VAEAVQTPTVAPPPPAREGVAVAETIEGRRIGLLFGLTGIAVFALMGVAGLAMRESQAGVVTLPPRWFYRLLTLHGIGMLTASMAAMMGASWYALAPLLPLSYARMRAAYLAIVAGVGCVLVAVLWGGFAPAWTFLYPLPFSSAGEWSARGAAGFFVGVTLVGVGFGVFCADILMAVEREYGGLPRALGWRFLAGRDDPPPPPSVIGATVIALNGLLSGAVGLVIVLAELDKAIDSSMQVNPLWAKNLTYFFGHMFANMIIYLAAVAVYVLVPRYCGREWKTTRALAIGWTGTLVFLVGAYSHHLYMDFVQPRWAEYVSEGVSYAAALPVAVITIYTGVMLIWGSRYRWTLSSSLLYLGFAGWGIGGVGAVIDSLIPFNFRLHNTVWVVAHFHTYLLMGVVMWMLAVAAHLLERRAERTPPAAATWTALGLMVTGGYGLTATWFVAGALGVPRRYAVQPAGTDHYSLVGALFAVVFAVGFLVLVGEFIWLALWPARWSADSRPWYDPPAPWARADHVSLRHRNPAPRTRLVTDRSHYTAVAALAVICAGAFLPAVGGYAETSVRAHHLAHAAMFALGCMLGLLIGSTSLFQAEDIPPRGGALAVALLAPAAMLVMMTPSSYGRLEPHPALHAAYHLGVVALGLISGIAVSRLGRLAGYTLLVLAVSMGVLFAAGAP
jgi:cytochrome c oxidase subunit I